MTVELALLVSSDGIALVHRQPAGHWSFVGETAFDVPDLDKAMADLRKIGEERAGEGFATLIVLPDDQILYTSLTAPTDDPEMTAFRVEEGLEGMTPYAVSELVFDWRPMEADRIKLAVVARETLDEARAFAETHGFNPAGFAAMPPQERFPGVPLFDLAGEAAGLTLPDDGLAFGPDTWGMPEAEDEEDDVGLVEDETESAAKKDAAPEPEDKTAEGMATDAEPPQATEAPSTPDAKPSTAEPGPAPEPPPEPRTGEEAAAVVGSDGTDKPAAASEPKQTATATPPPQTPEAPALDASRPDEAAAAPKPEAAATPEPRKPEKPAQDTAAAPGPVQPAEEGVPELDPEEVLAAAAEAPEGRDAPMVLQDPTLTSPVTPLQDEGADRTEDSNPDLPPAPSSAGLAARKAGAATPDTDTPGFSSRGEDHVPARNEGGTDGSARPATSASTIMGETAKPTAERASRNPLAEGLTRVRDASRARDTQKAAGATDKALKPAPRRGADGRAVRSVLPPPSGAAPERKGRLTSLTASPGDGRAGDGPASAVAGVRTAVSSGLSGLLGRGRQTTGDGSAPAAPRRTVSDVSGPGRLSALGAALRKDDTPHETPAPAASGRTHAPEEENDTNITGGLLGRTPEEPAGPSLRTGLLLTIVLLILLAAIAVWSALFLPDSPVARLLGGAPAEDAPALSQTPPAAITAPPAIGELAPSGAPPATLLDDSVAPEPEVAATSPDDEAAADGLVAPPEVAEEVAEAPAPIPELPPLPQDAVPSLEEARAVYDEYGIWPRPPERPDVASFDSLSDLGLSARDPDIPSLDAIALPAPRLDPTEVVQPMPPPPPFGSISPSRAALLTEPTPEGAITAAGVRVTAGQPPVLAIPRPDAAVPPAPIPSFSIEDAILGTFRPTPRPGDLGAADAPADEPAEPALETTTIQRAAIVPLPRSEPPAGAEAATTAAAASLFPRAAEAPEAAQPAETAPETEILASAAAVQRSLLPAARPSNMDALVAAATPPEPAAQPVAVEPAAVAPAPSIPSSANVARAATQENAIRLRQVNLIGVTGTASERRALVRLPSGRFVRVGVGDRLDGGRVAAIGESTLQYVRSGRTVTLDIPS